jgi:hypothetical protein
VLHGLLDAHNEGLSPKLHILAGKHCTDTRQAQSGAGVQTLELSMSMRRTQHCSLQGAGFHAQIIGVCTATAQQGMVFQPLQTLAQEGRSIRGRGRDCLQIFLLVPVSSTPVLIEQVSGKALKPTNPSVWRSTVWLEIHPNRLVTLRSERISALARSASVRHQ